MNGRAEGTDTTILGRRQFIRMLSAALPLAALSGSAAAFLAIQAEQVFCNSWEFTDDAGRRVSLPKPTELRRVATDSDIAEGLLFAIAPERAVATVGMSDLSAETMSYLPDPVHPLHAQSGISDSNDTKTWLHNVEAQAILSISCVGSMSARAAAADALQAGLGMPVICLDGAFTRLPATIRKLGHILGAKSRADSIASFCEAACDTVGSTLGQIPSDQRRKALYLTDGVGTAAASFESPYAYALKAAGAINVCDTGNSSSATANLPVTATTAAKSDPYLIFVSKEFYASLAGRFQPAEAYLQLSAAKQGRIKIVPTLPFCWLQESSGIMAILGMQWAANLLYPESFRDDPNQTIKDFFSTVWQVSLTDAQVARLFKG